MLTKRNWLFSFHCFFDPIWFVSIPSFFDPKTHPFKALRRQLRLLLLLCTIPSEIVFKLQKWFLIRVRVKRGGESKCTNKTSKTQNWYSQMSKTISSQVYLSKHDILGLYIIDVTHTVHSYLLTTSPLHLVLLFSVLMLTYSRHNNGCDVIYRRTLNINLRCKKTWNVTFLSKT